jgi:hypothetical protein
MAIIFQYIVERHGKTLLPQYLGMYRLTVDGVEHYVVAIRNVFSNHLTTHKKFDLKGSTVDREASDKEKEKDLPTYKDNDFVKEGMKIYIGEEAKAKLIETLTADVDVSFRANFKPMKMNKHTNSHTRKFALWSTKRSTKLNLSF